MNSFDCHRTLQLGSAAYRFHSLEAAEKAGAGRLAELPRSLKVLAENLLRHEDGHSVSADDIRCLGTWVDSAGAATADTELSFHPNRVIMPDASGIPLLADLCAMRDAMHHFGGDPTRINPLIPVDF
ncbi:MAG: aconitate hydratase, partial [Gammaproteobacteria bacterium]|nr:aconitate hydratase [Gammaproteobacteria bacterium]